jgi:hypothetical protein
LQKYKSKVLLAKKMIQDIFMPDKNESELAQEAKNHGFREIIFLYSDSMNVPKLKLVLPGLKISTGCIILAANKLSSAKARFDFVFAGLQRPYFELKGIDFILGSEETTTSDFFYQKRGGLDDFMCQLARRNNINLVFPVALNNKDIGRMEQNVRLCRKHKVHAMVATFARLPSEIRAPKDLDAFSRRIKII